MWDEELHPSMPLLHILQCAGLSRLSGLSWQLMHHILSSEAIVPMLHLQARSSKEEWMARGDNLIENHRYELAAKAYNSAGDPVRSAYAEARFQYGVAQELTADSESRKLDTFREVWTHIRMPTPCMQ